LTSAPGGQRSRYATARLEGKQYIVGVARNSRTAVDLVPAHPVCPEIGLETEFVVVEFGVG